MKTSNTISFVVIMVLMGWGLFLAGVLVSMIRSNAPMEAYLILGGVAVVTYSIFVPLGYALYELEKDGR